MPEPTIDQVVEAKITEATGDLYDNDAAMMRRIADLAGRVEVLEGAAPPPEPPRPPVVPPTPPSGLIPADEWTVYVDPANPGGFNEHGQFSCVGNVYQAGSRADVIDAGPGFGIRMTDTGEIHSFDVDGDTTRFAVRPGPGLGGPAFQTRMVWTGNGYQLGGERPDGTNLSVIWPDSDRTRFNGTRTDMGLISDTPSDPKAVWASRDGSGHRCLFASIFRVPRHVMARERCAHGGVGLHTKYTPRTPFTLMMGDGGRLTVVTRTQQTPWRDGYPHPRGIEAGEFDLAPFVETWGAIVHELLVDPFHGYLVTWLYIGGRWHKIVDQADGLGFTYAEGDPRTRLFYPKMLTSYWWHNDATFGDNWDDRFGPLRETWYGPCGVMVDTDIPAASVGDHCEAALANAT